MRHRRYKQAYFLLFMPPALQLAFFNLYFERIGLNHGEIGTVAAVNSLVGIVAPLYFGHLADRLGHKRRLLIWLALAAAVCYPLHWFTRSLALLLPLTVALSVCRSPMIPITDALCLDALQAGGDGRGDGYARVRLWGSIGFIVAATVVPMALADESVADPVRRLWPVFAGLLVLCLLQALRLATMADPARAQVILGDEGPAGSIARVLRVPRLKRLTLLLLVSWASNTSYYVFLSLYLDQIGVPDRWKGAFWSMGVLAEVLFMMAGSWLLPRLGVRRMLLWGLAGRTVRLLAYSYRWPPWAAFCLVQPLHALAFAATHLGTVAFLARSVPERHRALGQTLFSGLVFGLGGVLGGLMAGWISEAATAGLLAPLTSRTGLYASFQFSGWVQLAVLLLAWRTLRDPEEVAPEGR